MRWPALSKSDTTIYSHLSIGTGHDSSEKSIAEPFQHGESSPAPQSIKPISWLRRHTTGWRFGVLSGAASAFVVFIINLSIFVWAEKHNGYRPFHFTRYDTGQHTFFDGSCEKTRQLNTGVHVLINVLSTTLLSASNYCMQCMSAPTRRDVDNAHARRRWLDVGVQSMRNLLSISRKRAVLYLLLGLSSLPLHLFYNSTVFSSIAANDYYVYSANAAFANAKSMNFTGFGYGPDTDIINSNSGYQNSTAKELFNKARGGALTRLEPADCLTAYAQVFQTNRGSLILISPDDAIPQFNEGTAAIWFEHYEEIADNTGLACPFDWMCLNNPPGVDHNCMDGSGPCQFRLVSAKANISSWQPFHKEVLYCLVEPIEEHCKLEYSTYLAVLVIVLNAVKAIMMFYLAIGISEAPLMTIGDAVASFLDTPDPSTQGMCLVTKEEIRNGAKKDAGWVPMAKKYVSQRRRKFAAASQSRWIVTIGLVIFSIVFVAALLIWGMTHIPSASRAAVFSLGLAAVTPVTFIRWTLPSTGASAVISNVLVANVPQVVLSFVYFAYNALFTSMSLAAEWSRFALARKGVRVSDVPLGHQRGKYFLQLPYRVAMPLLGVSALLHWLVSQSIFLVAIDTSSEGSAEGVSRTEASGFGYMTCGYSPLGMVCVIVVGCVMIAAAVGSGFLRLSSGMPVVGSCSAAISAGCHGDSGVSDESDNMRSQERVMWGVIGGEEFDVGHCGLSDRAVTGAVEGRWYAGTGVRRRC